MLMALQVYRCLTGLLRMMMQGNRALLHHIRTNHGVVIMQVRDRFRYLHAPPQAVRMAVHVLVGLLHLLHHQLQSVHTSVGKVIHTGEAAFENRGNACVHTSLNFGSRSAV